LIWIALLRGINVGGHGKVTMAQLRDMLAGLGWPDVRTYVQSGNVVFRADQTDAVKLEAKLAETFSETFGFEAPFLVRSLPAWTVGMEANPYPEIASADPTKVHLLFLGSEPSPQALSKLEERDTKGDQWQMGEGVVYLHTPNGMGRSKFAPGVEKSLGVPVTARNWRSVVKLEELGRGIHGY
jgi:uncharacterized protein (DUF1697 family)